MFLVPGPAQAQPASCAVQILAVETAKVDADGGKPAPSQWQTTTLPDNWNHRQPDYGGAVWYRIDWQRQCSGPQAAPVALVLQSVVLAGEVFVNDELIWRDKQLIEPLSRSWNMPRYWRLPEAWLHEGVNTLWVRVVGVAGQSLGLGAVYLGAPQVMERRYDELWWRHRTLFMVNVIVSSVMAVLFFCIWIVRRDKTAYGWYALMSLFWVLFIANVLITTPWPLPTTLMMARVNIMALALSVACFCMFTWRFGEQNLPRTERALWLVSALLVLILILVPDRHVAAAQMLGVVVTGIIFLLNILQFSLHALRTRQREHVLLALCLVVLLVANGHDFLLLINVIADGLPISPYTSIVITLCLSGILGLQHAHNVRRIEHFNQELGDGITRAQVELATTLERKHDLKLANARLEDRLQIAHDLHDGLGGSLVHMMASVELAKEPMHHEQVLSMLKLIRDDLRQTIDSGSSAGVTVPATPPEWIAPLRYRFTELFDELGIATDWTVAAHWRWRPTAIQCLALTRLVEEALTNVVKHSRADHVHVRLELPEPDQMVLGIEDDGDGFDVEAVRLSGMSVGMRSMQMRVSRVGGRLEVESRPGRTLLTARLILQP